MISIGENYIATAAPFMQSGLFRPYPTTLTHQQFVRDLSRGSYCNTCFVRGVTSVILMSPGFQTIMYIVVTFAFPIAWAQIGLRKQPTLHIHILLHITHHLSDKCTTGRGIYTHTNTCSPGQLLPPPPTNQTV